ncbi:MAG: hypothetical protein HQM08_02210 [Candidatus Riflebacteria bacterium]|nr:hypothetical protein [Candidatus Riflebacteria bacterium]
MLRRLKVFTIFLVIVLSMVDSFSAFGGTLPITNPLKAKLKAGKPVFGAFVTIPSAKVVENLAVPGKLDFVWIEAEHTEFGPREVQDLTIAAENEGLTSIVRVPTNDRDQIKKFVGTGVLGVIVANISSADDARKAIANLKYPPLGCRTVGPERGNRYLAHFKEYLEAANDQIMVILMIETPQAIAEIDQIVRLPGIDVLHIGLGDLSLSLGAAMDSPKVREAVAKVESAARGAGIPLGGPLPELKKLDEKLKAGYRFFTIPGDMEILQQGVSRFFTPGS